MEHPRVNEAEWEQTRRTCIAETPPATPLEYTIQIAPPQEFPLDAVVYTHRDIDEHGRVFFYGVVESTQVSAQYTALVKIIRTHPEDILLPPRPGDFALCKDEAKFVNYTYRFTEMRRKMPVGLLASGNPAYFNLDFLSGERGAHVNIAGMSGVATKTSYSLFLLYSLFHSDPSGRSRAIIFNVKGDDLLYLDKPNARLTDNSREQYQKLSLPCGPFPEVAYHNTTAPLWTMRQFAEREFIRFLFTDPEQTAATDFAIDNLAWILKTEAAKTQGEELIVHDQPIATLDQLTEMICEDDSSANPWFEKAASNTRTSVIRRLRGITLQVSSLLGPTGNFNYDSQLNVIDLHRLQEKARAFVVGSVLKTLFDTRESQGEAHPTVYLVLDELNKYASRESAGPIREMLLDVAERGRSLGIILIGAEQTASEVEERVVGNSAIRVVGRLESGESLKDAYSWLSAGMRRRATLLRPGTMVVSQPEVPVPLVVRFPFPAWATRRSEVGDEAD